MARFDWDFVRERLIQPCVDAHLRVFDMSIERLDQINYQRNGKDFVVPGPGIQIKYSPAMGAPYNLDVIYYVIVRLLLPALAHAALPTSAEYDLACPGRYGGTARFLPVGKLQFLRKPHERRWTPELCQVWAAASSTVTIPAARKEKAPSTQPCGLGDCAIALITNQFTLAMQFKAVIWGPNGSLCAQNSPGRGMLNRGLPCVWFRPLGLQSALPPARHAAVPGDDAKVQLCGARRRHTCGTHVKQLPLEATREESDLAIPEDTLAESLPQKQLPLRSSH
ncbi:uncharacterized protein LOC119449204 [Dermacentor silvarum]|uniref:uncharacterized protein LOC119449204 n=1 Tax=Dermacentor silvarum TaxID=543639 RepID=UPI0021012111|nr:uncharacterized protein LOC119449204 [Dermacentor silvarum]